MLRTWINILLHPQEAVFEKALANASQHNTFSWFGIGILVAATLSAVSTFIHETLFKAYVGSRQVLIMRLLSDPTGKSTLIDFAGTPIAGALFSFFSFLVSVSIGIYLGLLISFWFAKMLGGTGNFEKHCSAFALFIPSLMIIINFLGIIRVIGVCIALPLGWVYALILSVIAVKSIHGLSTTKSIVAMVVPFAVLTFATIIISPPHL